MPIVRGQWAEMLAAGLVTRTVRGFKDKPEQFRLFMKVMPSDAAWEDDQPIDPSFGPLVRKPELGRTVLDEPIKLPGKRIIHDSFGLAYLISKEARDDDKVGLFAQLAESLGRSSRITFELWGHDLINNGFSTTKYVGRDGKALFATDHPMFGPDGGTIANKPAVDVDLSDAALEAAILSFRKQKDERGFPTMSRPVMLLITPEQEFTARRILEATGQPGVNEWGSVNVLRDQGLRPMLDDWLTDPDAWFLLGEQSEHDLRFYIREPMDTYTWDDMNALGTYHSVFQRHSTGFGDWRNVYGSPGA